MTAPVHIVGGFTTTGICGAFMGLNILESPYYLGVTAVASLLPDIDHPKSPIGLLLYPLARFIN